MGGVRVRQFVRDGAELAASLLRAKLTACPHCGRVGALNLHGVVTGYAEVGSERVQRGHRLFCSNRGRRPGCGRTFAVLLADTLGACAVRTGTLWSFLLEIATGLSRKAAWEATGAAVLSLRSGYRLWHRFARAGPTIRTRLSSHCPPPPCDSPLPMAQLTEHLRLALPCDNPLSDFQHSFQLDLLS
jgi:hypothetical protein